MPIDYYKVLGVERNATSDEIEHEYKEQLEKCTKKIWKDLYEPYSRFCNVDKKLEALEDAYIVLSDPNKKAVYDEGGDPFNFYFTLRASEAKDETKKAFHRLLVQYYESEVKKEEDRFKELSNEPIFSDDPIALIVREAEKKKKEEQFQEKLNRHNELLQKCQNFDEGLEALKDAHGLLYDPDKQSAYNKDPFNCYSILDISRDANENEIEKAYHRLLVQYYENNVQDGRNKFAKLSQEKQDGKTLSWSEKAELSQLEQKLCKYEKLLSKHKNVNDRLKALKDAYRFLSNPRKKAAYDEGKPITHYVILGVERGADTNQITIAYRKLAMEYHEDRGKTENNEEFTEISEAYEVLSDPEKRSKYNRGEDTGPQTYGRWSWYEEFKRNHEKYKFDREFFKDLEEGIKSGDLKKCRSLINKIADDSFYLEDAVNFAVLFNQQEILIFLIEKGRGILPNVALNAAVKYNSKQIFDYLLSEDKNKVDVNYKNQDGNTALHHALGYLYESGYQNFVKPLLNKGAKLDVENNEGETPLNYLVEKFPGGLDTVSQLIREYEVDRLRELKHKDDTFILSKLVELAIKHNKKEFLILLIEKGAKISPNVALNSAFEHASKEVYDYLLSKYKDEVDIDGKDEGGNTFLHRTLQEFIRNESKYKGFVESLLRKGARLDIKNEKEKITPFDLLIDYVEKGMSYDKAQRLTTVSKLLSNCKGKDVLKELSSAPSLNKLLELAVKYECDEEVLISLIEKGAKISLHHALKEFIRDASKYQGSVELLLSKGARLDVKNDQGETPFNLLIDYVEKGSSDKAQRLTTVLELLGKCKNKNALKELKYKDGTSALNKLVELAVKQGSKKVLDHLLNGHAGKVNIDHQDGEKNTALHHALKGFIRNASQYQSFVELLLSKGARLDVKNDQGETPFDLLVNYVKKYYSEEAQRLTAVSKLLSNCKGKDVLKELSSAPSLNKLVELAVKHDSEKILDLLIEEGAGISLNAALNGAIKQGSKRIFDCLLNKHAGEVNIDHQDEDKNTALHHALQGLINAEYNPAKQNKCKNFVESLLGKGAKPSIKNKERITPCDLLIDYVTSIRDPISTMERLEHVSELLDKCKVRDKLKELRYYKDSTPALDKLEKLEYDNNLSARVEELSSRLHSKPKKNTSNNSLWCVIGAIAGAAIGAAIAYSITDAFPVIIAAVVIGSLLGMAVTYGVSKCLEQSKVEQAYHKGTNYGE